MVEFFIDADSNGVDYFEVGINGENVYYDYVLECLTSSCGGWASNSDLDMSDFGSSANYSGVLNNSSEQDVEYVVEIEIPFTTLNAIPNGGFTNPVDGTSWKANMFRIDQSTGSSELLSWTTHNSDSFHQPDKFGTWIFEGDLLTSIDALSESTLSIYPNPTSGEVNFSEPVESLTVYNALGESLLSKGNVETLDLSSMEAGMYTLSIMVEGQLITKKVIVE